MLKKAIQLTAACSLVVSALLSNSPVLAAQNNGDVTVNKKNGEITIGNTAISRTFGIENNKLTTKEINNLMGNSKFTPSNLSEEFVIRYLGDGAKRQEPQKPLTSVKSSASTATEVTASSKNEGEFSHLTDGNIDTYWQSNYQNLQSAEYITVDFKKETSVKSVVYTPRFDNGVKYNCTGNANKLNIYAWVNGQWEKQTLTSDAAWTYDENKTREENVKTVELKNAVSTTKIKIEASDTYFHDQNAHAAGKVLSAAEIDVKNESNTSVINKASSGWVMTGTSVHTEGSGGDAGGYAALIDGDKSTYYHSNYGAGADRKLPVDLTLDRGANAKNEPFQTLGYVPRPQGVNANGNILNYEIYVSDSKDNLFTDTNKVKADRFMYTDVYAQNEAAKYIYTSFETEQTGRFVGIRVKSSAGENKFAAGAEIDLFKEKFDSIANPEDAKAVELKASDLTFKDVKEENTSATINGVEKTGKMLTFTFEPKAVGTNTVTVKQKVVMYNGDHFMRKFLEIENSDKTKRIDYIDGEHLMVNPQSDKTWTIPHAGDIVAMEEFKANLGQPIYINGMFLGSEFPAARNEIEKNLGMNRYYTGKNFNDFKRDNQLTKDGKYVTWQTVLGASPAADAEGLNLDIVKQSFFNYIDSIATPSEFRIQYNSWFDNMMKIDDKNILDSFIEIDKELSNTGVRPLDSYVVDDGWVNYNNTSILDPLRSGTTLNQTGFWEFNSKFPQKLTPSSQLVQNFGSNFGVWIGPRGGYNFFSHLADILVKNNTGSKAGNSIDVADSVYVKKFEEMAIEWMRDYKVNYWKWDGFADGGQYGHFPSGEGVVGYSESNRHMYGGPHHMYHVTDLWEKWIGLMKNVRKAEKELGINKLWISLTCYVNPSPWFLQWANSVWIQCVADRGERHNGVIDDKMNAMLTYRDGVYYDFTVNHKYQFPLQNIYNHDPIYGQEDTGIKKDSMDGEQFRNYMFMQGTRGTAFWELYYSDALFNDEKYLINADFLEWAEGNFDKLKNAIMIGKNPSTTATLTGSVGHSGQSAACGNQDAYGFACFDKTGENAIISMRNPAATEKTIEFKLDDAIGAKAKGVTYNVSTVSKYVHKNTTSKAKIANTYAQGDTVQVTLQPGETYVLNFNKEKDTKAPTVSKLSAKDAKTLQVQTSEHVKGATFEVTVDGKKVNATVSKTYADLRTFDITLPEGVKDAQKVEVKATAGTDYAGNALTGSQAMSFYKDGLVVNVKNAKADQVLSNADCSVVGKNGFSVTALVNGDTVNTELLSQGSDYTLGVNAEGKVYFTVNDVTVTTKQPLTKGMDTLITAVRENNGLLKLYVDGQINSSAYAADKKDYVLKGGKTVAKATLKDVKVYQKALGYDEQPKLPLEALIEKVEKELNQYTAASKESAKINEKLAQAKNAKTAEERAAAYDALYSAYKQLVPETVENLALNKPIEAKWAKDGSDAATDAQSPITKANDGVANVKDSYAIFGADPKKEASYVEIDLQDVCTINSAKLFRYWDNRQYDATAFVVSETKDFAKKEVLFYSHKENAKDKDLFNLGVEPKDALYAEKSSGKELFSGKNVKARYVRLYAYGRADRENSASAHNNHINELQVFGSKGNAYDLSEIKALVATAKEEANKTDVYTTESLDVLNTKLAAAEEVIKAVEAGTQEDKTIGYILNAKDALEAAINGLVKVTPQGGETTPPTPPVTPENPGGGETTDPENPGTGEKPTPKPDKPLTPIGPSTPVGKPNTDDESTIKPVDPKPENKPNKDETGTGDVTSMSMFASMLAASGAAVTAILKRRNKK